MTARRRATAVDGVLAHATALELCALLPEGVRFDLVYLDPPFSTGRTRKRGAKSAPRAPSGEPVSYDDGASVEELLGVVIPSLEALRARMQPHATLFLHLDHRAVHDAKVAADRVLGRGAFVGEIVWSPGNGARGSRGSFAVTHQTILLYARDAASRKKLVYRAGDPALREPYAATSLSMHFRQVDQSGRRYRERVVGGKAYRYYADEGRQLGSVWTDIPSMVANTPLRQEGTGYPTQKPERLLERIVRAASHEGATVCDPMCGSGTSLVVASRLGRRFVGGDQSLEAVELTARRLTTEGVRFERLAR